VIRLVLGILVSVPVIAGNLDFSLKDAKGGMHTAGELSRGKATVFIFVATDCPNSNTYAPVMARLYHEYSPKGVAFFNVYSDPAESAATVSKHDKDFETPFRALLDPRQTLARETGTKSTPEAVVLGPAGQELYRGRIDNRFIEPGKTRYQPTENDLQEALDAILAGKAPPHAVTRTIGCAIPGIE
jgi:thiol-disulfide isomerase/thioredoxin